MSDHDYIPVPRVELPEDWAPEGTICALITIPDDPQYLSAIIGLVDQLRHSATFARDATKTGAATVARTWDAALQIRPVVTVDCEGVMTVFDVRQDPENPCHLQKSTDGGETWTDWADLSLCPPTVMLGSDGKTIVWWCPTCGPDGGPGWQPLPNPTPDYDPGHDDPQTIIDDWADEGQDPSCVFAANVTEAFKSVYERTDYGLFIGATTVFFWTEAVFNLFSLKALPKAARRILEIFGDLTQFTYEDWHADYSDFDWEEMTNALCCFFSADGTVTEASFGFGLGAIAGKTGPVWQTTRLLISAMGPNGLNNAATYAGITAHDCDCDCDLCQDFTESPEAFSVIGDKGEWTEGLGYTGTIPAEDPTVYQVEILGSAIEGNWSNIRLSFYYSGSFKWSQVWFDGVQVLSDLYGPAGGRVYDFPDPGNVESIRILLTQDTLNSDLRVVDICYTPED